MYVEDLSRMFLWKHLRPLAWFSQCCEIALYYKTTPSTSESQ